MSFLAYFLIALIYVCIGIVEYACFCRINRGEVLNNPIVRWILILIFPIFSFILLVIVLVIGLSDMLFKNKDQKDQLP